MRDRTAPGGRRLQSHVQVVAELLAQNPAGAIPGIASGEVGTMHEASPRWLVSLRNMLQWSVYGGLPAGDSAQRSRSRRLRVLRPGARRRKSTLHQATTAVRAPYKAARKDHSWCLTRTKQRMARSKLSHKMPDTDKQDKALLGVDYFDPT